MSKVHPILRVLFYFMSTLFGVYLGLLIFYYAQGYRYDRNTQKVYKTGIIVVGSYPSRAEIKINGTLFKKKSPTKIENLISGNYDLEINKDGFIGWKNSIPVKEKLVTWLQYPLLLPADYKSEPLKQNTDMFLMSNNHKKAVLLESIESRNRLVFYDLKKKEEIGSLQLSIAIPVSELKMVSWNEDDSAVLLYAAGSYFLAKQDTGEFLDLTTLSGIKADEYRFSKGNANEIYFIKNNTLYLLNIQNKEKRIVAEHIVDFETFRDFVLAVNQTEHGNSLIKFGTSGQNQETYIETVPLSNKYKILLSDYRNNITVVLHAIKTGSLLVIPEKGVSITKNYKVIDAKLSEDDRFLQTDDGKTIRVNDFDTLSNYEYSAEKLTSIMWFFSNFHLLSIENNKLIISDFDNANKHELAPKASQIDSSKFTKSVYYLADRQFMTIDLEKSFQNTLF